MKNLATILLIVIAFTATANTHPSIEANDQNLKQRYDLLKAKTESYNDYKVIKESLLDAFWKLTLDSVHKTKADLREAKENIKSKEAEIAKLNLNITKKDEALAGILHDGTHITFLGIDFGKTFFITLTTVVTLSLIALCGLLFWRFRAEFVASRENKDLFEQLNKEFEDYKRKSLDKQIKLSRELQTERNRLQELMSAN